MSNYGKAYKQNRRTNAQIQRDKAAQNDMNKSMPAAMRSFVGLPATVAHGTGASSTVQDTAESLWDRIHTRDEMYEERIHVQMEEHRSSNDDYDDDDDDDDSVSEE